MNLGEVSKTRAPPMFWAYPRAVSAYFNCKRLRRNAGCRRYGAELQASLRKDVYRCPLIWIVRIEGIKWIAGIGRWRRRRRWRWGRRRGGISRRIPRLRGEWREWRWCSWRWLARKNRARCRRRSWLWSRCRSRSRAGAYGWT
jgi:hypothetical protein